jgi:predicted aspartyl protease
VQLRLEGKLAYVSAALEFAGKRLSLKHMLLDTGSAGTVLDADVVRPLGIRPEGADKTKRILGVGGSEFVYSKRVERLAVGELTVEDFEVQVGTLHYGFPLDGIIGLDFLLMTRAVIDFGTLEVRSSGAAR